MSRMVIHRENGKVIASSDSKRFNSFNDIVDFINSSRFEILKYENDNLFFSVHNEKIKIENYSTFIKDPVLYDFNRRVRVNILKLEKKLSLKRSRHQFLKVKSAEVSALMLGTMIVLKVIIPNINFEDSKMNNIEYISNPPAIERSVVESMFDVEKVYNEKLLSYSKDFGIDYDNAVNFLKLQGININDTDKVLDSLYEYSKENVKKIDNTLTKVEMENLIIKYINIMGVTDPDVISTMLAVFRLETAHGTSAICVEGNNLGGHRAYSREIEDYYLMEYKTPEIGAYRHVKIFLDIMYKSMQKETYDPSASLEFNINPIYCGEAWWYSSVSDNKKEVEIDYANLLSKNVR